MAKEKKKLIAITGNFGSGKSTLARFISDFGYPIIIADEISKEILAKDVEVRSEIINYFGAQCFNGKKVDTKFLAAQVFIDSKKLKKINSILHPRVSKQIEHLSKKYFKVKNLVFVEAALIFESKMEKMFDYVVLVTADRILRMKRATSSNKYSETDFINRDSNQLSEESKGEKADFIFANNGSVDELKQKATLLIKLLESTP